MREVGGLCVGGAGGGGRGVHSEVRPGRTGKNWSGRQVRKAFQARRARARTKGRRNPAHDVFGK